MQHQEDKMRSLKNETINHMFDDQDRNKQARINELTEG